MCGDDPTLKAGASLKIAFALHAGGGSMLLLFAGVMFPPLYLLCPAIAGVIQD